MARAAAWVLGCLLVLFPGTSPLVAQTGEIEEPAHPWEPSPEPPPRGVFLPCGAASAAEAARMQLRVELPPVPAYPPGGEIPEELHDRLVYLDEETGDLVLSFPSYPGEELEPGQELVVGRVVQRVPSGIASCPSLSVAIYQPGDPRTRGYIYRYRIQNLPQAGKPIGELLLPVTLKQQEMPLFGLVQPHGWGVDDWELPAERVEQRAKAMSSSWGEDYRREVRHTMLRRRIRWYSPRAKYNIAQGKALEPFGFTTEALPGIVRAYVVGKPSLISTSGNWGWDLREQLWAFKFDEVNSLSMSTLGPKFSPDTDKRLIAVDFLGSLEELIEAGELEGESPFIRKVLPLLETVAGGDAVEAAAWPSEAETDFQAELLMALRLSLEE